MLRETSIEGADSGDELPRMAETMGFDQGFQTRKGKTRGS